MRESPSIIAEINITKEVKILDLVTPYESHRKHDDILSTLTYSALISERQSNTGWYRPMYIFSRFSSSNPVLTQPNWPLKSSDTSPWFVKKIRPAHWSLSLYWLAMGWIKKNWRGYVQRSLTLLFPADLPWIESMAFRSIAVARSCITRTGCINKATHSWQHNNWPAHSLPLLKQTAGRPCCMTLLINGRRASTVSVSFPAVPLRILERIASADPLWQGGAPQHGTWR